MQKKLIGSKKCQKQKTQEAESIISIALSCAVKAPISLILALGGPPYHALSKSNLPPILLGRSV